MSRTAKKLWILAASAGLAMPAIAQTSAPKVSERAQAERDTAERLANKRVNIEFGGGRLREYVTALREATRPEMVNVVAPESLLNMKLGEISLRDVDVSTAVKSLEWAAEPRGTLMVQSLGANSFGVANGRYEAEATTSAPGGARSLASQQIQVLSLRDLTEPMPGDAPNMRTTVDPDVVITAVRTAVGAGGEADGVELKYHSDSGLLIVRGTVPQIQAASTVIDRMQNDMRSRRKAMKEAMAGQANLDEIKAEAEKQAIRVDLLEANFARSREEVSKLEQMRAQGVASDADAASARASFDRAKAELEAARIDRGMAEARVRSIEKRMAEAASRDIRAGEEGLGEIPEGRSVVEYTSASITGQDLKALATSLETAAAQLLQGQSNVAIRAEGDTLVVTAGQPGQRLIRRMLLDHANPAKGPVVQKSRPKPMTEEKPAR